MEADSSITARHDAQLSRHAQKEEQAQSPDLSTASQVESTLTGTAVGCTLPRKSFIFRSVSAGRDFLASRRALWKGSQSARLQSSNNRESSENGEGDHGTLIPLTANGAIHTGVWTVHSRVTPVAAFAQRLHRRHMLRRHPVDRYALVKYNRNSSRQAWLRRIGSHARCTSVVRDAQNGAV
jgi:hypothetical protein